MLQNLYTTKPIHGQVITAQIIEARSGEEEPIRGARQ
jgi:hypothetical protein